MQHANLAAAQIEHVRRNLLRLADNARMQQRHRVVNHAERRARHTLEHLAAALRCVNSLVPAGLDQNLPAHGLGARADIFETLNKRIERLVGHAVVRHGVLHVRTTGLGANRAAAEHLGKAQACLVLGKVVHKLLAVGSRQVFIAAENSDRNACLVEHRAQVVGKLARKAQAVDAHRLIEHLARQLDARKAQLARHANALLDRSLRKVVQAHARSNGSHAIHIPCKR